VTFQGRILAFLLLAFPAAGQRAPQFKSEVQPVLEKNCVSCHGPNQKMAGLDLSSFAGMMAGGSSGPVIAPNKPERSLLWNLVESGKMPMGGKLTAAEKQLLRAYIEQGRFPAAANEAELEANDRAKIKRADRQWWSFRKPVKPAIPVVRDAAQVRTPIDAFVLTRLEARDWKLQPEAGRSVLIRRAYLDLTGLLPSAAQVKAFVDDQSPNAYEKVIDELLASPHYGEEWGRHWLDIAGYSDTVGDASDRDRDAAWKYRDYVIAAINKNKPFDRFLLEQFAGDQLVNYEPLTKPRPDQLEAVTATGFLRMTADITDNQTIYEVDKYFDAQQKVLETSLKAVMGLSIQCARCHDHKFDPILQRDYYKLMAAYQPTWDPENWLAGSVGFGPWPSRMVLDVEPSQRDTWIKEVTSGGAKALRREQMVLAAVYQRYRAELKAGKDLSDAYRAEIRKEIASDPDLDVDTTLPKDFISDEEMEKRFPELAEQKAALAGKRKKTETKVNPNYIMAVWDVSKTPSPTYILQRGNYLAPTVKVEPGLPYVLDNPDRPYRFADPKEHPEWLHTGRRLALAKWFVQPDNPLTARVFVNRVWQFHFGEGIVASVDDFGAQGAKPIHPELLDWLAVSFVEHNWDIKWLNKQIMLSQAYRQASGELPAQMAADPSDKLLWRKAPLRLEAESVRDTMLQVSGLLNQEMGGHQIALTRGADGQWIEDLKKPSANRRSIYLAYSRTRPQSFLRAFDCPDMTSDSQTERFRSALPIQSLALLNNAIVARAAGAFAAQVLEQSKGDIEGAVTRAYELAYFRKPDADDFALAKKTVAAAPDAKTGLRLFLQAMMGANEFLYNF
jgi:mono/diheme cytochrome c family protein